MRDLDPDDPQPPYLQLAAVLRDAIGAGEFAPGDRLPSRAELTACHGLAGATIQRAIDVLADQGLVVRRQGAGVFVRTSTATLTDAEIRAELAELRRRLDHLEEILTQRGQNPGE